MSRCTAITRTYARRCQREALEGSTLCSVHSHATRAKARQRTEAAPRCDCCPPAQGHRFGWSEELRCKCGVTWEENRATPSECPRAKTRRAA